jgi:hypothetical protein
VRSTTQAHSEAANPHRETKKIPLTLIGLVLIKYNKRLGVVLWKYFFLLLDGIEE